MANSNIINAVFGSGICAVTTSAFRANYGMVLRFSGIDLPTAFEVDFSNYDVMGRDSITMIGQNGEVQIPDQLWDSGLNIYAYVYLHPTDDSGVTVYTVAIPVLGRPNRTEETPTPHEQSVIEQAISALNDAVEQTAADVVAADASAYAAAQSEVNAATSERAAAASAGAALASQNAAESAAQSATESASGAAESARNAAQSASAAAESATSAQASAEQAERSVQSITDDVERAERAANTASTKATQAEQSATAAAQSASSASTAAQNAASSASSAESHATDAETAKQDAQDAQAAAEQASEDSEAAADRAEQAEQEVLSAMDGTYENLTSGNAQQLLSTVTEADSVPYLFRQTAKNADRAYLDEVVGGTVAWNQLVDPSRIIVSFSGLTITTPKAGTWRFNGTISSAMSGNINNPSLLANHVYMMSNGRSDTDIVLSNTQTWTVSRSIYVLKVGSANRNANIYIKAGTYTDYDFTPQIIDLTQMFGTTIADYIYNLETASAGAGVAYFRKLFPNDYYEYNSGELLSVNTSRHKMAGFNQWDEEWEVGLISVSNGQNVDGIGIRSKNFCKCVSSAVYHFNIPYTSSRYVFWYDANENYIRNDSFGSLNITSPDNASYFKIRVDTIRTYNHDICINLSDPVRNGTYEPYTERTYPLDSSLTLRGIPKLDASGNLYYDGDTYAADGTVTRKIKEIEVTTCGSVGTSSTGAKYATYSISLAITELLKNNFLSNAYGFRVNAPTDGGKWFRVAASTIFIFDERFTDKSAADTILASEKPHFVYELATPTTETATPYRHLQICDPNGTEEFVSTGIVPVGHNTRYPENLRAKIEGLPWNFNSIIAMTETTTTASKAYSVGDYFILNNVLYRVTSAIASGGTITIGTNCRATTIMDEIKALS